MDHVASPAASPALALDKYVQQRYNTSKDFYTLYWSNITLQYL